MLYPHIVTVFSYKDKAWSKRIMQGVRFEGVVGGYRIEGTSTPAFNFILYVQGKDVPPKAGDIVVRGIHKATQTPKSISGAHTVHSVSEFSLDTSRVHHYEVVGV